MTIPSDPVAVAQPTALPTDSKASQQAPPPPARQDVSGLLRVEHGPEGSFESRAVSLVSVPAGAVFTRILTATPATVAYSSVQTSATEHIELNSDLVFVNHSCDPSLEFDMGSMEVRVVKGRDLRKGDELTFFYPSSEWDMAQPFQCRCGTARCIGWVDGAGNLADSVLKGYWLNGHIEQMLEEKRRQKS